MTLNDKLYVIEKMIKLIECEKTGNAEQFVEQLGISRGQFFKELEGLRNLGVDIQYNRIRKTFYYSGDKKIKFREPIQIINIDESTTINGGHVNHPTHDLQCHINSN